MAIKKSRKKPNAIRGETKPGAQPISFPVVGIGASAGGLEAFSELVEALPADTGMAFVFVQHLDPTHESMLVPLLKRRSSLPVTQVRDGMNIEPNQVYVIPPNTRMEIQNGKLKLIGRAASGEKSMPIDHFFVSLAGYCKEQSIGVLLSGTATDGTFGLKAIKAEGGICFAQSQESAKYPGMPGSAIASGCVDFALRPQQIALELIRIARHKPSVLPSPPAAALPDGAEGDIQKVLLLLRQFTGVDFTHYKSSTIRRRIARRMLLKNIPTVREYVAVLKSDASERDALYQDILIHVTSFFREPAAFQILKTKIIPKLIAGKQERDAVRVWVPGCSTGEEAYSIAILLAEYFAGRQDKRPVQIYATDLSEAAIEHARAGIYAGATLAEVSRERLEQFFVKSNGRYQIVQSIRDMCTFARQDLVQDPPFSRMDLISCRNVLIYLEPVLQRRALAAIHYALNPNGFLLLGKSETLNTFPDWFRPVEKNGRIYRKHGTTQNLASGALMAGENRRPPVDVPVKPTIPAADLQREADRVVWSRYEHAGVIVDQDLQILHFRGETSPYIAPASGAASLNLLKMARNELLADLRAAVQKAKRENAPVRRAGIIMNYSSRSQQVCVDVVPLSGAERADRHFLILFEKTKASPAESGPRRKADTAPIAKLQQELSSTRQHLEAVIEEQEATNEELKSANEEALANNEELQSSNEELETAREELQSTNEELVTLTEQQASRNVELAQLNDDLRNVLDGVQIPVLMLGKDRCIRRFTPTAEKLFNILPGDVGRPIDAFKLNLDLPDLEPLIARTFKSLAPQEQEVRDNNGHYYSMSVRPYRTSDDRIDGVLISFADTDIIKRSLMQAQQARDYAIAIVETVREPLVVLDSRLRVVTANRSFYNLFQSSAQATEKQSFFEIAKGQWDVPDLRELLEKVLPNNKSFEDFMLVHEFPNIGPRTLLLNGRRMEGTHDIDGMILLAIEDVTERETATSELRVSRQRLSDLTAKLIAAQEEERRSVARELHDNLNQRLAVIEMGLEKLKQKRAEWPREVGQELEQLATYTAEVSEIILNMSRQLHPSALEHLGLGVALAGLCEEFEEVHQIEVNSMESDVPKSLPEQVSLNIYRISQEALRNVAKHSSARKVVFSLVGAGNSITLTVKDNGKGFDPKSARGGLGLISMAERAQQMGGTISIDSKPGAGTSIKLVVPLPQTKTT